MNKPTIQISHLPRTYDLLLKKFALLVIGIFFTTIGAMPSYANIPLSHSSYHIPDTLTTYQDAIQDGGPPPDGIPSIDNPKFLPADQVDLEPGEPIIGVKINGTARAYPQSIVVHHEIVNDTVADQPISVTYCPLTATAQGFKRGDTTLGVSGKLLNSNLVMYDRAEETYFSQILATGVKGTRSGESLEEINLVWTTWERWQNKHPKTQVLSENTGYVRNYDNDPYGGYNPKSGYYAGGETMFPLLHESNQYEAKTMVLGARTNQRSVFTTMDRLRDKQVVTSDNFLVVYDPILDTGYVYERPQREVVPRENNRYSYGSQTYAPGQLPLKSHVSVEAFFFAWQAFYPDSERAD